MPTKLNRKGQVTIPKRIREALRMTSGCSVDFAANAEGCIVIRKMGSESDRKRDRFDAARGTADVKWRTGDLMALLRGAA